ncbi:hypothetical protein KUH03_26765 [Sphingobacterium sp. E70]|uniref:hypothetical protein n=1 Tax=Sphingobacterium sp. E70 TaxID=2853439 RepID=UPI00211C86ED|nr:hypothetical protein [Sphingobacterium sp. E70]ULT22874.1 hypothetical protein KUH03_26765 [Sphingobacterium sp. E70]
MNLKTITLAIPLLLLGSQASFGQLAAKKGITQEELYKHLNGLFQQGTAASKAEVLKEADYLAKSKKKKTSCSPGESILAWKKTIRQKP